MKSKDEILKEANGIIRSFNSVIGRKGKTTNWEALDTQVKRILKEQRELKLFAIPDVSGSLHTTTLEKSTDDFIGCDVVKCCKSGPITDEKYCPYCGKLIVRGNDH